MNLKEILKEFKKGWDNTSDGSSADKLRGGFAVNFLEQALRMALESCEPNGKVCGGDYQMNDEYEQCHGYNQAIADYKSNCEKFMERFKDEIKR